MIFPLARTCNISLEKSVCWVVQGIKFREEAKLYNHVSYYGWLWLTLTWCEAKKCSLNSIA